MTPLQAKKIAEQALILHGWSFTKLTAKTVSFSDLARGQAIFVTVKGLRDVNPDSHLDKQTRWAAVKAIAKTGEFFIEA
jgi:hypothetical protein